MNAASCITMTTVGLHPRYQLRVSARVSFFGNRLLTRGRKGLALSHATPRGQREQCHVVLMLCMDGMMRGVGGWCLWWGRARGTTAFGRARRGGGGVCSLYSTESVYVLLLCFVNELKRRREETAPTRFFTRVDSCGNPRSGFRKRVTAINPRGYFKSSTTPGKKDTRQTDKRHTQTRQRKALPRSPHATPATFKNHFRKTNHQDSQERHPPTSHRRPSLTQTRTPRWLVVPERGRCTCR